MIKEFVAKGFSKIRFHEIEKFNSFKDNLLNFAKQYTGKDVADLAKLHQYLPYDKINEFRIGAIQHINNKTDIKNLLLNECRPFLTTALGPDLVVQKNINLVLSLPEDKTSTIPLHGDTLTGHSVFEITILIPLTNVTDDDCMFIMDIPSFEKNRTLFSPPQMMSQEESLQARYEKNKELFHLMNLAPGEIMFFWHHLPHGNYVNHASHTHWSLNLRFKHLFSPYGEKKIGEYFIPWTNSPFTELALKETPL